MPQLSCALLFSKLCLALLASCLIVRYLAALHCHALFFLCCALLLTLYYFRYMAVHALLPCHHSFCTLLLSKLCFAFLVLCFVAFAPCCSLPCCTLLSCFTLLVLCLVAWVTLLFTICCSWFVTHALLPCNHALLVVGPCYLAIMPSCLHFFGSPHPPPPPPPLPLVILLPCCSLSCLVALPCQLVFPPHSLMQMEELGVTPTSFI